MSNRKLTCIGILVFLFWMAVLSLAYRTFHKPDAIAIEPDKVGQVLTQDLPSGYKWVYPGPVTKQNFAIKTVNNLDDLCRTDPVLQFVKEVNDAAVKSPEWNTNYTRAHYYTFVEKAQERLRYVIDHQPSPSPTPYR